MTDQAARVQALLGASLVAFGVLAFFYNGDFTSNESIHDDALGIFRANGWSATLFIATGVVALAARSRAWVVGLGALYVALAIWGFILGSGESILSIFPVNTGDSVLYLAIGIAAVAAVAT